jgi:hypothetical protein
MSDWGPEVSSWEGHEFTGAAKPEKQIWASALRQRSELETGVSATSAFHRFASGLTPTPPVDTGAGQV